MVDQRIYVAQDTVPAAGSNTWVDKKGSKMGFAIQMDFYTQMAIEGRCYQVKAGTITAPAVGDVKITDTAADMCVDIASGTTVLPVFANVSIQLAVNLLTEVAGKSVGALATVGAAFVPLPLLMGGSAAVSTARVAETGAAAVGVTVAAETATTTLRHFSFDQPVQAGAWDSTFDWEPKAPPVLSGVSCFYIQVAADLTAGPSYFAHFDYIELPTTSIS